MVKKLKCLLVLITLFAITNVKAYTTSYIDIENQNIEFKDTTKAVVFSDLSFQKYDIINAEWNTSINDVTFAIKMPKKFDKSKLDFFKGTKSSIDHNNLSYSIDGNTIKGKYNDILKPNEGMTVRLILPDGYFKKNLSSSFIIPIIISSFFVFISLYILYKYFKEKKTNVRVSTYPPERLNILDIGFRFKGVKAKKCAISLLIYLANEGYLKIEEEPDTKKHKITKVKDYDGDDVREEFFLQMLFADGNEVTDDKLNEFLLKISKLIQNEWRKSKIAKISDKKTVKISIFLIIIIYGFGFIEMLLESNLEISIPSIEGWFALIAALLLGMGIIYFYIIKSPRILSRVHSMVFKYTNDKSNIMYTMLIILIILIMFAMWKMDAEYDMFYIFLSILFYIDFIYSLFSGLILGLKSKNISSIIEALISIIICGLLLTYFSKYFGRYISISYIVELIFIAIIVTCFALMDKDTRYDIETLEKIESFKKFIINAKSDDLKVLIDKNSKYFYDVFPYAYIFELEDELIKKFESFNIDAPNWYKSYDKFDIKDIDDFTKKCSEGGGSSW